MGKDALVQEHVIKGKEGGVKAFASVLVSIAQQAGTTMVIATRRSGHFGGDIHTSSGR